MKNSTIGISIMILSVFYCYNVSFSQTTFSDKIIIMEPETSRPTFVSSCDMDGDGDLDALIASDEDDKVSWYPNMDGLGTFGEQRVITSSAKETPFAAGADLDGDGDLDVVSAYSSIYDSRIVWYENTDGKGNFSSFKTITDSVDRPRSVYICDLDGDGDLDVLSASAEDDKIAWYENSDGMGSFGVQQVLTDTADGASSVYAADLDNDGDMDVLSASWDDDKVAWYENIDGLGSFGEQQIITTDANAANYVCAADLDSDGDMDVLASACYDDKIVWFENTDGGGTFGSEQVIINLDWLSSLFVSDFDGDGDMDVLTSTATADQIAWYENTDGLGSFGAQNVILYPADGAVGAIASDVDGDGDMDVLCPLISANIVVWFENTDGNGSFGAQQDISLNANGPQSVYTSDLDGDGDLDVLSASRWDDKIAWYENTDGMGSFGEQQIITTSAFQASCVYTSDLDGDGDMDALSASYFDDKIAWYENTDGLGTFGEQQIITTLATGALSVYTSDLDNDGDMDVLSVNGTGYRISWYENTDGLGSFGEQLNITANTEYPSSVYASDLDGDGDMDVLSSSKMDDKIAWYENYDGLGSFGAQQVITTSAYRAQSVYASDLDGDGDNDVLSASSYDDKIAWYENTDGLGSFGAQKVITTSANIARCVYAADLDNDGDMDVLSASRWGGKWYENIDGSGTFGEDQFIGAGRDSYSITASDLDGDGDMDVLLATERDDGVYWFRNLFMETKVHERESVTPIEFQLSQNYPNPFNNETVIQFDIREKGNVNLTIYNMLGTHIVTIAEGHYQPGSYKVRFDGSGLPSGIYLCRLQAEGFTTVRKMVLME